MKKILFSFILLFAFTIPVFAADNKLYLTENNNKIYYNENLFDSRKFMYHINMIPGGKYLDELLIENAAGFPMKLYLKIKEKEQSEAAEELLDNIYMKIYLNDNKIYDGKVKGLDYKSEGINLQDSVLLKEISNNEQIKINVELTLSPEYSNADYNDYSYLDWVFIAEFDTQIIEVVPAPITGRDYNYVPIIIASIGLCTVTFIFVILIKKRRKEQNR